MKDRQRVVRSLEIDNRSWVPRYTCRFIAGNETPVDSLQSNSMSSVSRCVFHNDIVSSLRSYIIALAAQKHEETSKDSCITTKIK